MLDIIAGESTEDYVPGVEVFDAAEAPAHVGVVRDSVVLGARDADEVSDLDLLAMAAEDAVDAHEAREIGGPALDEVGLQRAVRRARQASIKRVLRTQVAGGVA